LKEEQKKEAMWLNPMLKEGAQVFMETYKGQRGVIYPAAIAMGQ